MLVCYFPEMDNRPEIDQISRISHTAIYLLYFPFETEPGAGLVFEIKVFPSGEIREHQTLRVGTILRFFCDISLTNIKLQYSCEVNKTRPFGLLPRSLLFSFFDERSIEGEVFTKRKMATREN